MVRCFVGIFLPDDIKNNVMLLQRRIAGLKIGCKLVEKENIHISLSFLGDVDGVQNIVEKIKSVVEGFKKNNVDVKNLLLIPSENFIRVLALDVVDKEGDLEKLRIGIHKAVDGKSHKAHVTLCRVKNILDKKAFLEDVKPFLNYGVGSFEINEIQLIESKLSSKGPVYSVLERFDLK